MRLLFITRGIDFKYIYIRFASFISFIPLALSYPKSQASSIFEEFKFPRFTAPSMTTPFVNPLSMVLICIFIGARGRYCIGNTDKVPALSMITYCTFAISKTFLSRSKEFNSLIVALPAALIYYFIYIQKNMVWLS